MWFREPALMMIMVVMVMLVVMRCRIDIRMRMAMNRRVCMHWHTQIFERSHRSTIMHKFKVVMWL